MVTRRMAGVAGLSTARIRLGVCTAEQQPVRIRPAALVLNIYPTKGIKMANCDLHIPDDKLKSLLHDCIDFRAKFLETLQDPDVKRELTKAVMNTPVDEVAVKADTPAPFEVGQWVHDPDLPYAPAVVVNKIYLSESKFIGGKQWRVDASSSKHSYLGRPASAYRPATNAEVAQALGLKGDETVQLWMNDGVTGAGVGVDYRVDAVWGERVQISRINPLDKTDRVTFKVEYRFLHLVSRASRPVEQPSKPEHDFVVGEVLRVRDDAKHDPLRNYKDHIGRSGVLVATDDSITPYCLGFTDGTRGWFSAHELHRETHAEALERLKAGRGDKVRIVGKPLAPTNERGWDGQWQGTDDAIIGKVGKVIGLHDRKPSLGIDIQVDDFVFQFIPAHVLELVSRAEPATAPRPFQWRDLVEIVGPDSNGKTKYIGLKTFTTSGVFGNSKVRVSIANGVTYEFPSSSLRLLRTAEEVVKWAGGKQ